MRRRRCLPCVPSKKELCDLLGEPPTVPVDDHRLKSFRVGPCRRHSVRDERFGAAKPISAFYRLVVGSPGERAAGIVSMTVLLRPARAMLEEESRELRIATEHRVVQG